MSIRSVSCAVILSFVIAASVAVSSASDNVHHVSSRVPIQGTSREMAAERSVQSNTSRTPASGANANPWRLQATLPGAIIHDISFATPKVGYAAAELGQVWKTADGGSTWKQIMNLGFPYYWYGVKALSATKVVISGFNDSTFAGIIRWSQDGGSTWTSDITLTSTGWSDRVRFANAQDGLVLDIVNLDSPNSAHYTMDGGAAAADWTQVVPDPNGGWFGDEFSLLPNLHARASGITYCSSVNAGSSWTCGPSVDSVFDGPVFFANDQAGWVGGGEIAPNLEGWVHRTTDGGATWSGRTLDIGWPIRELYFLTPNIGWAAGGDIFSNVGGIYFSRDGGQTWSLDLDSGHEMSSCDSKHVGGRFQIWCAGSDGSLNGAVYTLRGGAN